MGTYIKAIKKFEKKSRKQGPSITISGLSCSGKTTVAEYLAKKLKLKLVEAGGDFWRSIARERGLDLDKLSKSAEREVDIEMDKRTLEFAQKGGVVLLGRLAGWAAGDWADFRIMLTATEEERARRSAGRDGITLIKAKKLVRGRDLQDKKRYLKYYGIDISDYSIYNLVLDTTNFSIEENRKTVFKIVKLALSL